MGRLVQQVKALGYPLDQLVVIGSGLLDALNLRESGDIDLVVSDELFEKVKATGVYASEIRYDDEMLTDGIVEFWHNWKSDEPFEKLKREAVELEGVLFAHPATIVRRKQERGSEKDLRDIQLLEEYLNRA